MSNIDLIRLKMIFYLEYWISKTFFIIHFWKTLFSDRALFLSYHVQPKTIFIDINFLGKNEHSLGWEVLYPINVVLVILWIKDQILRSEFWLIQSDWELCHANGPWPH